MFWVDERNYHRNCKHGCVRDISTHVFTFLLFFRLSLIEVHDSVATWLRSTVSLIQHNHPAQVYKCPSPPITMIYPTTASSCKRRKPTMPPPYTKLTPPSYTSLHPHSPSLLYHSYISSATFPLGTPPFPLNSCTPCICGSPVNDP